jgi:hypothetical protein
MSLVDFGKRLRELETLSLINSLTESGTEERLVTFSLHELVYVNTKISPTEYEDLKEFIRKLLSKKPLLKAGAENKSQLREEDFIYY